MMGDLPLPFISVIIPTRERADTLKYAIASVLDQETDAFEVIISDNCSEDNTKDVFESFSDERLRYVNTGRRLSMCDNYEFALDHAVGRYVVIMGDDDAVMPGALDRLQTKIEADPCPVYTWPKGVYNWPTTGSKAAVAVFPHASAPFELDLKRLARKSVSQGFWGYSRLPSVYHSAVAKDILDKIRKSTGRVFHSTQPDLFTGFAIPAFADRAINLGFSVTVNGRSPKSNAAVVTDKKGLDNIKRYIEEFGGYQIHPSLFPDFPGMTKYANLLPDSLLVAMDMFPQLYGNMKFNYEGMWTVFCLNKAFRFGVSTRETIRQARRIQRYHPFGVLRFLGYLLMYKVFLLGRQAMQRPTQLGPFKQETPENIYDFVKHLAEWQASQKKC
jgi:glycosyltransferase involved in cell wall biosynthesis